MAYTIQSGDTLAALAARWGTTVDAIMAANPQITDRNLIYAGKELTQPGEVAPATAPVEPAPPAPTSTAPAAETGAAPPSDTDTGPAATTAAKDYPGLMSGGTITQIERPGLPDTFAYMFEYPKGSGRFVAYTFSSMDQIEQAIGPDWYKTIPYETRSQDWYQTNAAEVGTIGELVGQQGDFYALMDQTLYEAGLNAGITDPTLLGQMLNDPEMQTIMVEATTGNWSPERIRAAQRNTDFWKNTLYPGIENLYGKTGSPEAAYATYMRDAEDSLVSLGYKRDADGTFKSTVARMLDSQVDVSTFNNMAPIVQRAKRNTQYANTLAAWGRRAGLPPMTFNDLFDILDDATPAEWKDIVEKANLQYQADMQNLHLSAEQIGRVGDLADLSEAQARQAFQDYSQILTSLAGAIGPNGRYDLTADEILSLRTGITPTSGRSAEEIRTKAVQAARELGAVDDKKLQFFVGYDTLRGTPTRPGLTALAPESA